jgi:hypothetical protein
MNVYLMNEDHFTSETSIFLQPISCKFIIMYTDVYASLFIREWSFMS